MLMKRGDEMKLPSHFYEYLVNEEIHPDGTVIIQEGNSGDWIYVLLEGKAIVKKKTPRGDVVIDYLKKGNIMGEMVLLHGWKSKRFASVIADGPVTIGVIDTERLVQDWNSLSASLQKLISSLIKKRQEAVNKLISMSINSK